MMRLLACVLLCTASTVQAQTQLGCGKPKDAFADVAKSHGEKPAQVFVRDGGQVVFFTVNPETGTWTLFAQQSADTICPVMGGDSWRDLTVPVKPEAGA